MDLPAASELLTSRTIAADAGRFGVLLWFELEPFKGFALVDEFAAHRMQVWCETILCSPDKTGGRIAVRAVAIYYLADWAEGMRLGQWAYGQ